MVANTLLHVAEKFDAWMTKWEAYHLDQGHYDDNNKALIAFLTDDSGFFYIKNYEALCQLAELVQEKGYKTTNPPCTLTDFIQAIQRANPRSFGDEKPMGPQTEMPISLVALSYVSQMMKDVQKAFSLHEAIKSSNLIKALELIEGGANVNLPLDGETPLHLAAKYSSVPVMVALLAHGADIHARNKNQETPLFIAIKALSYHNALFLIKKTFYLNVMDLSGKPLIYAALDACTSKNQWENIVLALIQAGAYTAIKYQEKTLLTKAIEKKLEKVIEAIHPEIALHRAIRRYEHAKSIELIERNKIDLNFVYKDQTPLHRALTRGQTEIVKALLIKKVEVDPLYQNRTPLEMAILLSNETISQLLIDAGAHKELVVYHAIQNNETGLALSFDPMDLDIFSRFEGKSLLFHALDKERTDIVTHLLEVDAETALEEKKFVLKEAIAKNNARVLKAIIHLGVPFEFENFKDALDLGYLECTQALLPFVTLRNLQTREIFSTLDYFDSIKKIKEYVDSPIDVLIREKFYLPLQICALRIFSIARNLREIERTQNREAGENDENAMVREEIILENHHFKTVIRPHFQARFNAYHPNQKYTDLFKIAFENNMAEATPDEKEWQKRKIILQAIYAKAKEIQNEPTLVGKRNKALCEFIANHRLALLCGDQNALMASASQIPFDNDAQLAWHSLNPFSASKLCVHEIEEKIRAFILAKIIEDATDTHDNNVLTFIEKNKAELIARQPQAMRASCSVLTAATYAQSAWRGYNPYVRTNKWVNLLTPTMSQQEIFSTPESSEGLTRVTAQIGSDIIRERAAYYFLVTIDEIPGENVEDFKARQHNFFFQHDSIQNAHGPNAPSCFPGHFKRLLDTAAFHSEVQLPKQKADCVDEVVRPTILAAFQHECGPLSMPEKDQLYHALMDLTEQSACEIAKDPSYYPEELWLLREHFIQSLGKDLDPKAVLSEVITKFPKQFSNTPIDNLYVEQATIDLARGKTGKAITALWEKLTNIVPTNKQIQAANPFKKEHQAAEWQLFNRMFNYLLDIVPSQRQSLRKMEGLVTYLEMKTRKLLNPSYNKQDIVDEIMDCFSEELEPHTESSKITMLHMLEDPLSSEQANPVLPLFRKRKRATQDERLIEEALAFITRGQFDEQLPAKRRKLAPTLKRERA